MQSKVFKRSISEFATAIKSECGKFKFRRIFEVTSILKNVLEGKRFLLNVKEQSTRESKNISLGIWGSGREISAKPHYVYPLNFIKILHIRFKIRWKTGYHYIPDIIRTMGRSGLITFIEITDTCGIKSAKKTILIICSCGSSTYLASGALKGIARFRQLLFVRWRTICRNLYSDSIRYWLIYDIHLCYC